MEPTDAHLTTAIAQSTCPTSISGGTQQMGGGILTPMALSPGDTRTGSIVTSKEEEEDSSNAASSDCKSPGQRYANSKFVYLFFSCLFSVLFPFYYQFCFFSFSEIFFVLINFMSRNF